MIDIEEVFERHADEYGKFDRVEKKLHDRSDICAFLLLDKLASVCLENNIVSVAERDRIHLSVEPGDIAASATEDDVVTLIRCGVVYDAQEDGFTMLK